MTTKVLIKNMDEQLYRLLKTRAAILGISVCEAIQQAISIWLDVTDSLSDRNRVVLNTYPEAIKAYNDGKYILACDGEYIGSFDTEEEAIREAKKYGKCVIDYKGYPRSFVGEWGGSSIALE
jgi:hypothetical protein